MGGDRAPAMVLKGADIALQRHPGAQFLIFGNEGEIAPLLAKLPALAKAASVHHTAAVVAAGPNPPRALPAERRPGLPLAVHPPPDPRPPGLAPAAQPA